ncbi:MAG: DUF4423 domain-containing protein [Calothrix sp. SM1_5_4]|nr:DUF4423 domain-containing protein [Calothrix sp. SM1_5_4]
MKMTDIFAYSNYKTWLRHWLKSLPKGGRGQLGKLADAALMFSSSLSQILGSQDKHFTLEQAVLVADHVGLSDIERRYFLLLVQHDRAGSVRLRKEFETQLREAKKAHSQIGSRLPSEHQLRIEEETIFYSSWLYSAARVLTSLKNCPSAESLAERLGISRAQSNAIVDFLLRSGLCVEKGGRLHPGPKHTHLEATSPIITRHHANWRVKAMDRHARLDVNSELAYSAPMSLAKEDVLKVREELIRAIERVRTIIDPSPCETAYCLNIDWVQF